MERIVINAERLSVLVSDFRNDIRKGFCEVSIAIGDIKGIHFRLVAMSSKEKKYHDHDDTLPETACIGIEGGAK